MKCTKQVSSDRAWWSMEFGVLDKIISMKGAWIVWRLLSFSDEKNVALTLIDLQCIDDPI